MASFNLPDAYPPVPVTLQADLTQQELLHFPAFKTWLSTLQTTLTAQSEDNHPFHAAPYYLRSITVQSIVRFSHTRIGFMTIQALVTNDDGEWIPGTVFMRGGSVAMMIVLQPDGGDQDEEYVILTVQPRIAAGSLSFIELPAGMLDDAGTFSGAAAKEIQEETGLTIAEEELIDMTAAAEQCWSEHERKRHTEVHLQCGIYPSPGGCDEFIPIFLARKKIKMQEIEAMQGRLTGLRDHGEKITLLIVELSDVWKVAMRDGKALAALALYEGLKRDEKI